MGFYYNDALTFLLYDFGSILEFIMLIAELIYNTW